MPLTRLTLKGFQCHKRLIVEFSPGVTTLVGPSDSGKSAVLRGLRWVCFNQPDGTSFIRHGDKTAKVTLEFDDRTITRRRGKAVNSYALDGKDYVSFGRGKVPDDIARLLDVSPLSFQSQHTPAYWLALSAAEVSRELNAVVNLDLIDRALASAAAQTRTAQSTLTVCEQRLKDAKGRLGNLGWVRKARKEWDTLEGLRMDAEQARNRASLGTRLLNSVGQAVQKADRLSVAILGGKTAIAAGEAACAQRQKATQLSNLVDQLGKLCSAPPPPDPTRLDDLAVAAERMEQQRQRADGLRVMVAQLRLLQAKVDRTEAEADRTAKAVKKVLEQGCPLCGHRTMGNCDGR